MSQTKLELKPDWPATARRLEAWWERQIVDRAVIQVTAPRTDVRPRPLPEPATVEERWTNVDYVVAAVQERMRTTYYGGDAFPLYYPNLGPDVLGAYLGCPLELAETTSWSRPIIGDWKQKPSLRIDPDNRWWKLTMELIEAAMQVAPGRFIVGLTDLHGGVDALSALRGPERLCMDMIEHPQEVKRAVAELIPIWFEVYEGMRCLINPIILGTTSWLPTWTAGKSYPVSCDFMCMISPAMFEEFVLPDLLAETEWLDHSIFHLDGPGALKHLDALLEMPKLHAIQWVPGANSGAMLQWVPMLRRIQAAGRALHLSVEPEEVEPLMRQLRPEGLCLQTSCQTEEEAHDLVRLVERLTVEQR